MFRRYTSARAESAAASAERQIGLAFAYRSDVHAPSIAELTALFDSAPVSIAEIGVNRYLPLSEWPKGEISVGSTIAGRTLQMRINPALGEVAIEVDVTDRIASLTLSGVVAIEPDVREHGGASALVRCADGATVTVRLRPDVSISFDNRPAAV